MLFVQLRIALDRGKRAGTIRDFENITRIVQSFDALRFQGPYVEAQDIDNGYRHYAHMKERN